MTQASSDIMGIAGAGTMGAGIAIAFANAGYAVRVYDPSDDALTRAATTTATYFAGQVTRGKLDAGVARERAARITRGNDPHAFADVALAVEAVFEDLAVKRELFATFGAICKPQTLLATNTSTLDVDAIAQAAPHPERALGLHFFSPAHVMKLVEVVRGGATSPQTIATAQAVCTRLGKRAVIVGNGDGFVGNRMLLGYRREAELLVLAGATPSDVDGALERFGFAMGPFAVSDLAGIDIGWRAKHERLKRGGAPPFALTDLIDGLVGAERLGQKAGRGYYRYEPGDRARHDDPAIDTIVACERVRLGIARRAIADREIVQRCVYALVMEGGRILDDGIAATPGDIDTIWVEGYGFPRALGGPMAYARSVGLREVARTIEEFRRDDSAFWRDSSFLRGDFPSHDAHEVPGRIA